jgi:superfamily I DNA/RNA helicase
MLVFDLRFVMCLVCYVVFRFVSRYALHYIAISYHQSQLLLLSHSGGSNEEEKRILYYAPTIMKITDDDERFEKYDNNMTFMKFRFITSWPVCAATKNQLLTQ